MNIKQANKQLLGKAAGNNASQLAGLLLAVLFLLTQPGYSLYADVQNATVSQISEVTAISRQPLHHNLITTVTCSENRAEEEDVKEEDVAHQHAAVQVHSFYQTGVSQVHYACICHIFRSERLISLIKLHHAWKYHIS